MLERGGLVYLRGSRGGKTQPIKHLTFVLLPISSPDTDTPIGTDCQPELITLKPKLFILETNEELLIYT